MFSWKTKSKNKSNKSKLQDKTIELRCEASTQACKASTHTCTAKVRSYALDRIPYTHGSEHIVKSIMGVVSDKRYDFVKNEQRDGAATNKRAKSAKEKQKRTKGGRGNEIKTRIPSSIRGRIEGPCSG